MNSCQHGKRGTYIEVLIIRRYRSKDKLSRFPIDLPSSYKITFDYHELESTHHNIDECIVHKKSQQYLKSLKILTIY